MPTYIKTKKKTRKARVAHNMIEALTHHARKDVTNNQTRHTHRDRRKGDPKYKCCEKEKQTTVCNLLAISTSVSHTLTICVPIFLTSRPRRRRQRVNQCYRDTMQRRQARKLLSPKTRGAHELVQSSIQLFRGYTYDVDVNIMM